MSKKQIVILVLVVAILIIGLVAGFVVFNNRVNKNKVGGNTTVVAGSKATDLNTNNTETIPLGGDSQKDEPASSLSVNAAAPQNSAQLGSGTQNAPVANNNSNSGNNNNTAPGPETFGQYEQYKNNQTSLFGDISVGSGGVVQNGKKVAVLYKGYLTNGKLFDQNTDSNKPFVYTPGSGQVIKGWEESIPGMKVGGVRRIIVPPIVGYGDQPQSVIPANSVLVFDVQVLAVE